MILFECSELLKNWKKARQKVMNDASAAALAEVAGEKRQESMVYLLLSNSVGGAVFLRPENKNGDEEGNASSSRVYTHEGDHWRSSEFGHMTLYPGGEPCYCGKKGCVDVYCSAKKLAELENGKLERFFEKLEETREPYLFLPESRRYTADGQHLNLPIPFCAGDIVRVDCRPFQPEHPAVLLEVGDNTDCCCVQALCRGQNGTWTIGALKHGNLFSNATCFLSPLYRLEVCPKPLPESDCLLQSIQDFIAGDEKRGRLLWERLRRLDTRTDAEIRLALAD